MSEIQDGILAFLEKSARWVAPKEITQEIYPNFRKSYAKDTFGRLVRRELKKLIDYGWIWKHKHQHYYHTSEFKLEEIKQIGNFLEYYDLAGDLTLSRILLLDPTETPIISPEAKVKKERERALQRLRDAEPTQIYVDR